MKDALASHDDELALQLFEKIELHFKEDVKQFAQGAEVLADIARRKKEGTLSKPALRVMPDAYSKWSLQEKTRFLIQGLEDYSSSFLGSDLHLAELIELGEEALPALFDCLEKDNRLARSGREGAIRPIANKERFYVREIAYDGVKRILKHVPHSDIPHDANRTRGEYFRLLGAEARKYWEANKVKPELTRFYESLCDLKLNHRARAGALESLVKTNGQASLPDINQPFPRWPVAPLKLRADLAQFQKPTVAEAILQSLDHDLKTKRHSDQPHEISSHGRTLHSYENCHLVALIYLGDRGIIPELQRRERSAALFRLRLKYCMTLHKLGDSQPLVKLAVEISEGREPKEPFAPVDLRTIGDQWGVRHLEAVTFIQTLMAARLPKQSKR